MKIIKESDNRKSDYKIIVDKIKWWGFKPKKSVSDKSIGFKFANETDAENLYKDLNSRIDFKDGWRLRLSKNYLFWDSRR